LPESSHLKHYVVVGLESLAATVPVNPLRPRAIERDVVPGRASWARRCDYRRGRVGRGIGVQRREGCRRPGRRVRGRGDRPSTDAMVLRRRSWSLGSLSQVATPASLTHQQSLKW